MEYHHHVGRTHRLQRSFALPDRRHADLSPRGQRVHANLVDINAKVVRRCECGLDVLAPRREVADHRDRLALLRLAQLELAPIELNELRWIDLLGAEGGLDHRCIMARQIWWGVAGISMSRNPTRCHASSTALITAAGAAMVPASPHPFAPSGFGVHGWLSSSSDSKKGTSLARGSA